MYLTGGGGFLLQPTTLPEDAPYPIFVGGSAAVSTTVYNVGTAAVSSMFNPKSACVYCRDLAVNWRGITNVGSTYVSFPYKSAFDHRGTRDGAVVADPIQYYAAGSEIFGQIDGMSFVTGHEGIAPEDTINDGVDDWIVVQNAWRNTDNDFAVMRLS